LGGDYDSEDRSDVNELGLGEVEVVHIDEENDTSDFIALALRTDQPGGGQLI